MDKRVVIVGFTNEYDLMDVNILRERYTVLHVKMPALMKSLILRLKSWSERLYLLVIKSWLSSKVSFCDGDVVFFDDSFISTDLLNSDAIHQYVKIRIILLLRNIINNNERVTSIINSKKQIEVFSFDPNDCKKFNIKSYKQYCSGVKYLVDKNEPVKSKFCLYFIGLDKGRSTYLNKILNKSRLYKSKVYLVKNPIRIHEKILKLLGSNRFNYLSYKKHLDNILESDVVIDIVQNGQSGLTMRSLEALISGKKIITNNSCVINEQFYNKDQIFVIRDIDRLTELEITAFIENGVDIKPVQDFDFSVTSVYESILGF